MQLERLLQSQGFGTRKECRALIRHGRCTVAGEAVEDPFAEIVAAGLEFAVDGVPWRYREKAYVLLYKPADTECSRSPRGYPGVLALLPPPLYARGMQSVGRLDVDTTGLLLLTDDGAFIHAVTSPKRKVHKIYRVTAKHPVTADMLKQLTDGVVLNDAPEPVAAIAAETIDECRFHLTISEGRYHQVKRMVAAAGNRIEALCRVAVGGLTLPETLQPGEWQWLEEADLRRLWNAAELGKA
ncbi:MAG: 16S rRNA pseudouridine(516) synthase [Rhodocyclaceae bacterium]|jgi:16S rRNA pseudouridine516 synthase|nr:16S rRNA pseudouridine(516) synthase [Rhodocyclaceae bacterium]